MPFIGIYPSLDGYAFCTNLPLIFCFAPTANFQAALTNHNFFFVLKPKVEGLQTFRQLGLIYNSTRFTWDYNNFSNILQQFHLNSCANLKVYKYHLFSTNTSKI